jgi:ATP-dependent DNA helicase RecQ
MTSAATTDVRPPDVRASAEAHLRALVGSDDATLREDQWAAIEALAVNRRRALVVQRTSCCATRGPGRPSSCRRCSP